MATLVDLATRIAQDMKGRALVGHTHSQSQITGLTDRLATIERTTGWRVIALEPGWGGRVLIRRDADRVTLRIEGLIPPAGSFAIHAASIPVGFLYSGGEHYIIAAERARSAPPSLYGMYSSPWLSWLSTITGGTARPTTAQHAEYTYRTNNPWPTTLPAPA